LLYAKAHFAVGEDPEPDAVPGAVEEDVFVVLVEIEELMVGFTVQKRRRRGVVVKQTGVVSGRQVVVCAATCHIMWNHF
jgi:hypothetical protein